MNDALLELDELLKNSIEFRSAFIGRELTHSEILSTVVSSTQQVLDKFCPKNKSSVYRKRIYRTPLNRDSEEKEYSKIYHKALNEFRKLKRQRDVDPVILSEKRKDLNKLRN